VSEQTMLIHVSDRAVVLEVWSAGAVGVREIIFGFHIEVIWQKILRSFFLVFYEICLPEIVI
jgi:hypothetical protein